MNSRHFLISGLFLIAACTTASRRPESAECRQTDCVAMGERQQVFAEFTVTPVEVLEDSRCPIEVECVWAGRVRLKTRIDIGHESLEMELDSSEPLRINGGFLSVAEVAPKAPTQSTPIKPEDYRFAFTFAPDVMETH